MRGQQGRSPAQRQVAYMAGHLSSSEMSAELTERIGDDDVESPSPGSLPLKLHKSNMGFRMAK